MIDPKSFIRNEKDNTDDYMEISGTFACEECRTEVGSALLNMDTKEMMWKCDCGHITEGSL